jgi:hypothetical protein
MPRRTQVRESNWTLTGLTGCRRTYCSTTRGASHRRRGHAGSPSVPNRRRRGQTAAPSDPDPTAGFAATGCSRGVAEESVGAKVPATGSLATAVSPAERPARVVAPPGRALRCGPKLAAAGRAEPSAVPSRWPQMVVPPARGQGPSAAPAAARRAAQSATREVAPQRSDAPSSRPSVASRLGTGLSFDTASRRAWPKARVSNKTHPCSLSSDVSRHFGYTGLPIIHQVSDAPMMR